VGFEDFVDGNALSASQLDNLMTQGTIKCTSGTRPSAPSEGTFIYETDTDRVYVYNGGWFRTTIGSSAAGCRTGVKLRRVATQSIGNATGVDINWDTEDRDSDSYIGVTSSTVTIPSGLAGVYVVTAGVLWASDPTTAGPSHIQISMGGRFWRDSTTALNALSTRRTVTAIDELAVADTLTVEVYQTTGGSINVTTAWLQAYRVLG